MAPTKRTRPTRGERRDEAREPTHGRGPLARTPRPFRTDADLSPHAGKGKSLRPLRDR